MKKQISLLTVILFAVSIAMVACKSEVHTHTFAEEWKTDGNFHWKECECGEIKFDAVHTFGDWEVIKEATEEAEGSQERVCDVCKYKETEEIAQLNHKHVAGESWKNDDKNHWKECRCGEKIESAEHEYEWTVTKEATCTEEGTKTGTCKVCKKEVTEKISAKGHSYSESRTSDASGHWYECVCGEKKDFEEHTYDIWKVVQEPTASTEGTSKRVCDICKFEETKQIIPIPEGFVLVEAGTFKMGSNEGDVDNKPVHKVTITKPFYMGKYEVTQAEYEKYCIYTESSSPSSDWGWGDGDNYPAYYVSWYDALVYCNKRSIAEGLTPCYRINGSTDPAAWGDVPTSSNSTWNSVECNWNANGYRLPTEAEWEYAARAGDNTVDSLTYSGTSDVNELGDYAWYYDNSDYTTYEVGTKLPNAFGLYDMSGNVWEWCWNWFTDSYDTTTEGGSNPTGPSAGSYRVCRGGSWGSGASYASVSLRNYGGPSGRGGSLGFRVVRASSN